jgi:hypothetical protein
MEAIHPGDLAQQGPVLDVFVPAYDWERQRRWDDQRNCAGQWTSNSVQTFDNSGKPKDAQSDHND